MLHPTGGDRPKGSLPELREQAPGGGSESGSIEANRRACAKREVTCKAEALLALGSLTGKDIQTAIEQHLLICEGGTMAGVLTPKEIKEQIRLAGRAKPQVKEQNRSKTGPTRRGPVAAETGNGENSGGPPTPPGEEAEIHATLDRRHAIVQHGGRVGVLTERPDGGFDILSRRDFQDFYAHLSGIDPETGRRRHYANTWFQSTETKRFRGIGLFPPGAECPEGYRNTWRGWAYEPKPGKGHDRLLSHVFDHICARDETIFHWLMQWLAEMFQGPGRSPVGTAVVLRGAKGCGKTIFVEAVGSLFGPHFRTVTHAEEYLGTFNGFLRDTVLLNVDEGFWAGDKGHDGKLKRLITGPTLMLNQKFFDAVEVHARCRLIFTTNAEWAIPATESERRFLVLDVMATRMQDAAYFGAIQADLYRNGGEGFSNLLDYFLFLPRDPAIDLRNPPKTRALAEQVALGMDTIGRFWHERLSMGTLGSIGWPVEIETSEVYKAYLLFCENVGERRPASMCQLGKRMCERYGLTKGRRGTAQNREYVYRMPELDDCRRAFERECSIFFEWED